MTLFQALSDYRWAAGWNVALGSLANVETDIGAHNRRTASDGLRRVGIASPILDPFPIRTRLPSGRERGDGFIDTEWTMILCQLGLDYVLDNYFSADTVASAQMTIYTKLHKSAAYARYNAYAVNPSRTGGDIEYLRQNVFRVRIRFNSLIAL